MSQKPEAAKNAVEEPAKQPVRKPIKRQGSSYTPSIKDALEGKLGEKGEEDAKEKLKYYTGEQLHESFTKEQFAEKWSTYLLKLNDRPNLKATLSKTPEVFDGHKLSLKVDNSVQLEEISKIKPDLVSWLRKELRNTNIELITEIEVQESSYKPYSESEKLAEMVKKNPALAQLKQKFNLDFGE